MSDARPWDNGLGHRRWQPVRGDGFAAWLDDIPGSNVWSTANNRAPRLYRSRHRAIACARRKERELDRSTWSPMDDKGRTTRL